MQAPRTWGWTVSEEVGLLVTGAGPTHVGMDRSPGRCRWSCTCRPHARGDGPDSAAQEAILLEQAPRTWGWTDTAPEPESEVEAGPTHVGMDRQGRSAGWRRCGRPHARGDGPVPLQGNRLVVEQAPRTWGWTELIDRPDILEAYERRQAAKN